MYRTPLPVAPLKFVPHEDCLHNVVAIAFVKHTTTPDFYFEYPRHCKSYYVRAVVATGLYMSDGALEAVWSTDPRRLYERIDTVSTGNCRKQRPSPALACYNVILSDPLPYESYG